MQWQSHQGANICDQHGITGSMLARIWLADLLVDGEPYCCKERSSISKSIHVELNFARVGLIVWKTKRSVSLWVTSIISHSLYCSTRRKIEKYVWQNLGWRHLQWFHAVPISLIHCAFDTNLLLPSLRCIPGTPSSFLMHTDSHTKCCHRSVSHVKFTKMRGKDFFFLL